MSMSTNTQNHIVNVSGPNVRKCMDEVRKRFNFNLATARERGRKDNRDGTFDVYLANGMLVKVAITTRQPVQIIQ